MVVTFDITNYMWVLNLLRILIHFCIVNLLAIPVSVICYLIFKLYRHDDLWCWVSFRVLLGHYSVGWLILEFSLAKCLFKFFPPFFIGLFNFLLLTYKSCLYILVMSYSWNRNGKNIFPFCGLPIHFLLTSRNF